MENNKAIQNMLDKVATACTCDEKIYFAYRHTFQAIYSHMQGHATTLQKFKERSNKDLLDAIQWGEGSIMAQCKFEIYFGMFRIIEDAILHGVNPCVALSKFKEDKIDELCMYNGTSTSVLSNAIDHFKRVSIQQMFRGFNCDYIQIAEITQREEWQA